MNTKKKQSKKSKSQALKLRDLKSKKNPKGGFGGPVIGPSGRGG